MRQLIVCCPLFLTPPPPDHDKNIKLYYNSFYSLLLLFLAKGSPMCKDYCVIFNTWGRGILWLHNEYFMSLFTTVNKN